jgi:hypothetical protein
MVPVLINNSISLPFILDTGSAEVAIPTDVFLTLLRTGTVKQSDFIGTGTYVLADGSEQSSHRFVLHELKVGDHVVRNVIANVAPVKGAPLLGQSFLSKLPAWAIDNEWQALAIGGGAAAITPEINPPGVPSPSPATMAEMGRNAITANVRQMPEPACTAVAVCQQAFIGGRHAFLAGKYQEAIRFEQNAAALGSAQAAITLGMLYLNGFGAPQDWAEAMKWFQKAAARGNTEGEILVRLSYAMGRGVSQDCGIAKQWLTTAAINGDDGARTLLSSGAGGFCRW